MGSAQLRLLELLELLELLDLMGSLERNLKMLAAILLLCVALGSPAEAVQIDVICVSLCPDSTRFISQQIPPMYEAIGQHVEIKFRPYGFATTTEVDGSYQFECQHGERECYGNIVQACTVHYTSDQDTLVNLITCMMSSSAPDQAGPDCFQQFGVDYQPVQDCIESGEGAQLHAENGEEQNGETPTPNNVPWINLDQEHLAEYWELEEYGLLQFICDTFDNIPCEGH